VDPENRFPKKFAECFPTTSGEILFDGKDINKMSRDEKQHLRSEIGTVFRSDSTP
jgi:phospholipid/cholesterol/gamma-HCH transport system ATP-binding protein